jgi:transposase
VGVYRLHSRKKKMSLRQQKLGPVPEDTARVAKVALKKKRNAYVAFADTFGDAFEYYDFEPLYSQLGQSAEHPARAALLSLVQFAEGLSDRDAAEAVANRIDLKYLLRLPLDHQGFDHTMLSDFRARLLTGGAERLLFDKILELATENGLLKKQKQRTDSTHILAAVRDLNRLELLLETVRAALDALTVVAPKFVLRIAPALEMCRAYEISGFSYRLPKKEKEQLKVAESIGRDGFMLLDKIDSDEKLAWLREVPAVQVLRLVWQQQFDQHDRGCKLKDAKKLPPAAERIASPRDLEARGSYKRSAGWLGYKAHITETCDLEGVNLITDVLTTAATTADSAVLPKIQRTLRQHGLKPDVHLADAGYSKAENMLTSKEQHEIEVLAPIRGGNSWQSDGFQSSNFTLNWETKKATCPVGVQSQTWKARRGGSSIEVEFPASSCTVCQFKSVCTKSQSGGRRLEIKNRRVFDFLASHRARETSKDFKKKYAKRAGIEGTLSRLINQAGLRRTRYVGLQKAHLQNLLSAAAMNLVRIAAHLLQAPTSGTRLGRFGNLRAAA